MSEIHSLHQTCLTELTSDGTTTTRFGKNVANNKLAGFARESLYETTVLNSADASVDITGECRAGKCCKKSRKPEKIRLRVNGRERQRMHDINSALDALRQVIIKFNILKGGINLLKFSCHK